MKGLILNQRELRCSSFFTLFQSVPECVTAYNWLISGTECYPQSPAIQAKLNQPYIWITGENLLRLCSEEDFQWIWGVFSGFDKSITLEQVARTPLPYADGYPGYWKNPVAPQHPLAEIELAAWDGCCSLFISKNDAWIAKLSGRYPEAKDLEQYNTQAAP